MSDVEVAVVGAGPSGSALAAMLGDAGVATALLDRASFPRDKPCGEGLMPAGVEVVERLGVDVETFPALAGVTYRTVADGAAAGSFPMGRPGRAVRRVALDRLLAERAASTRRVDARFGCAVESVRPGHVVMGDGSVVTARWVVGADGLRSRVARAMGWSREPGGSRRYALVGHVEAPRHGLDRVVVTLLDGCEAYAAPTGRDELLLAVLGPKHRLRREGERVRDAYARIASEAHPDARVGAACGVRGAGPFWVRPSNVAGDGVFLIGDAAGFLDPLTGDGMTDGLVAAHALARILAARGSDPERAYRAWEAPQWRRRVFVNRLALTLTGSPALARRAVGRLRRRPTTLDRLLEVNDGTRSLWSLSLRDWAALAGV